MSAKTHEKVSIIPAEDAPRTGEVVATDSATLMAVITRAASDPSIDVDKLERLTGLYERITSKSAEQSFNASLVAAQTEMRPVATDANNPQTRSRYASYLALDKALRPIYTRHGFSLSFNTADGAPEGHIRVVCEVGHNGGHTRHYQADMPADGKGAKGGDVMTKTHAFGAGVTYGQRYLLKMIFNVAVGADDDGNSGPGIERVNPTQLGDLRAHIESVGADLDRFLAHFGIETLADLPVRRLAEATTLLNQKARK